MTNPPIGKAPNDGGGEIEGMEKAREAAGYLRADNMPLYADAVDRLVRRVEEAEKERDAMKEKDYLYRQFPSDEAMERVMNERDTLKSKLSEAEKALERICKWDCACEVYRVGQETLSRLRADGGGRMEDLEKEGKHG